MKKQLFKTGVPLLLLALVTLFIGSSCGGDEPVPCEEKIWYYDNDGDSFGDPNKKTEACTAPEGYVADNTDCDDNNDLVHPGATEDIATDIDENCNGSLDN